MFDSFCHRWRSGGLLAKRARRSLRPVSLRPGRIDKSLLIVLRVTWLEKVAIVLVVPR